VSPVLISLGTIGNALSMVVLVRLCRQGSYMYMYFVALALSDILALWSAWFRGWLNAIVEIRYSRAKYSDLQDEFVLRVHISSIIFVVSGRHDIQTNNGGMYSI
jgi:hypothetical protein